MACRSRDSRAETPVAQGLTIGISYRFEPPAARAERAATALDLETDTAARHGHLAASDTHCERLRQQGVRRSILAVARYIKELLQRGERREEIPAIARQGDATVRAHVNDAEPA